MPTLDNERLGVVFATRPDILEGIQTAADTSERVVLFNNIASFISEQHLHEPPGETSAKRRRVEGDEGIAIQSENCSDHGMLPPPSQPAVIGTQQIPIAAAGAGSLLIDMANSAAKEVILLEVKDVSVSIPQRKKYDLCFTKNYLYTKQVGTTTPVQGMVYDWSQIEFVFYTPIPEKSQLQFNYTLFPRTTALASTKTFPPSDFEPLVFTVPTSSPKPGIVGGYAAQTASQVSDSYSSLMHWAINSQLQSVNNTTAIVATDPRVFFSAVRQPHRPNERAVYVKAFRGSKDGYLFFLPNGILWGFKKPLLFIPIDRINSVSYVNVLHRTFNMVVEVDVSHAPQQEHPKSALQRAQWEDEDDPKTEEMEFSMIDQEDYGNIDENYVRLHGLNNRSMAEGRKAKRQLRENAKNGSAGDDHAKPSVRTNGEQHVDDLSQLKLGGQQLLEDDEDEDEDDYDPGSEGESEGEGDSSEEEDDDDDDEEEDDEAEGYDKDGAEEEGYVEDQELGI